VGAALLDNRVDVRAEVGVGGRLDRVDGDAQLGLGALEALVTGLVERLVVEPARVGDQARVDVAGRLAAVVGRGGLGTGGLGLLLGSLPARGEGERRDREGREAVDGLLHVGLLLMVSTRQGCGGLPSAGPSPATRLPTITPRRVSGVLHRETGACLLPNWYVALAQVRRPGGRAGCRPRAAAEAVRANREAAALRRPR